MLRHVRSLLIFTMIVAVAATLWPVDAFAQRARPRGHARVSRPVIVRTPVYRPYYPDAFFWSAGIGWGGWYGYPYWYQRYPYPPYRYYGYDFEASVRIEVKPKDAQVYVDGYFVGSVDDFDGVFQRLHVRPGEHLIEIYREGYRTISEHTDFRRGESYRMKFVMEPLTAGEAQPLRPMPDPDASRAPRYPDDRPYRAPRDPIVRGDGGAVAIRVQPAGATVIIDGERWQGSEGPEPLVVHLSEGTHRIDVQKDGYRGFTTEVTIRRGDTVPLNISLRENR